MTKTLNGTSNDDELIIQSDTISVQAGAGTDTVVFSGNYADYSFSQSDSFVPFITHNKSGQAVSLYGVEQLQFDDRLTQLVTSGSGEFKVNTSTAGSQLNADITALDNGGLWSLGSQNGSGQSVFRQRYDADGHSLGTIRLNTTPTVTAIQNQTVNEDAVYSFEKRILGF